MTALTLSAERPPFAAAGAPVRLADPQARSFFRRATIQTRLTAAFVILGALSLVGTLFAIWQLSEVKQRAVADLRVERLAGELHAGAAANTVRAATLAAGTDPSLPQQLAPALAETERRVTQLQQELAAAAASSGQGQGVALVREAGERHAAWSQAYRKALLARSGEPQALASALQELRQAGEAWQAATRAVLDFHGGEGAGAAALGAHVDQASRQLIYLFVVLTVVCLPFVVALFIHILRPMYVAVRIARKVADGDLTVKVRTGGRDELARLMLALDDMTDSLRRIVGEVLRGASAVARTGERVARSHDDLSQRTEVQASTLQQTASSMEELTATVAQNAETARRASELALGAAQVAQQGGEVVGRVVASMEGLSGSARRIQEISGVIDGIAFQTNILALNAAVEAARAGDQGRGFAVVAAEVRNLAQRSAEAAREIKALSLESAGKAGDGTRLVDAAGRTMGDIVASVRQVSDLIAEIAAASEEQRSGIEQVNTAIAQMDRVVQQNAALVEQTTQSTAALQSEAAALLASVSQFRLEEGRQEPPAAPPLVLTSPHRA